MKEHAKAQNTDGITDERLALLLIEIGPYFALNPKTSKSRSLVEVENAKEEMEKLLAILYQYYHEGASIIALVKGEGRKFHEGEKPLDRLRIAVISLFQSKFNLFDVRLECDENKFDMLRKEYKNFATAIRGYREEEHYALAIKASVQDTTETGRLHAFKRYFMKKSQQSFQNQVRLEKRLRKQETHDTEKVKRGLLKEAKKAGMENDVHYPEESTQLPFRPIEIVTLHFFLSV